MIDEEDTLDQAYNTFGGVYTPYLGYSTMNMPDIQGAIWWWKHVWKLKSPKKTRIYLWLALKNKVVTWGVLQKKK